MLHKSKLVERLFLIIFLIGIVRFANGQPGSLTYSTNSDISTRNGGSNFNISGQATDPRCVQISPDGTRVFVANISPDRVFQYNLSIPHDITSASYSGSSLDTSPQGGEPHGISFSKDGTYMYLGRSNKAITYTLSTPFEISSASFSSANNMDHLTLPSADTRGVAISNDGRKIFIANSNEEIRQYNLGTAYDLTTASDPGRYIDVLTIDSDINTLESVTFNSDGSKFFFTERTKDRLRAVGVGTRFRLSTTGGGFNNLGSIDVGSQDSGPRGVAVSGNGTRLYMVGSDNSPSRIYQYNLTNEVFQESSANDGSIQGELIINLVGDRFVGNTSTVESNLSIDNLPAGLGIDVAFSNNRTTAIITLTGNATLNDDVHSVSDLRVTFSNGAFTNLNTSSISNSTNFNTGLSLDFIGPPIFTSGNTASGPENSTSDVLDIQANNGDGGSNDSNVNYSITGGQDQSFFSINSGNGRLRFSTARDFENPQDVGSDNTYRVRVTATDKSGLTTEQLITVTVTDVNEAPIITSANSANFTENGTGTVLNVQANDGDGGAADANVTYSITGGADASLFGINAANGLLTFNNEPDFENPTDSDFDNDYLLQVTATDAVGGATVSQTITVTVTNDTGEPLPTQPPGATNIYFDGVDDAITIPASTDFDVNNEVTYSMWVKVTNPDANGGLLFRRSGGSIDDKRVRVNANRTVQFFLFPATVGVNFTTVDQIPLNEWTHIACTYQRNATAKIYFDGVEVASVITSNTAVGNAGTTGSLQIGAPNFFDGQLDEFKIFNTSHTPVQIQSDMASTNPNESDLVAYWNFDDDQTIGVQTTVEDIVNGNNGTFIGSPLWVSRVRNTLDDTNPGSLRYALIQANSDTDKDYIDFSISGAGVQTIAPTSALPTISQEVIIDGYSQIGATRNTLSAGNDAVLNIQLDGSSAGSVNGLNITAASEIYGLIIHGFANAGIALNGNGSTVRGVKIGENAVGGSSPNTTGIQIIGSNSTLGGINVAESNVIVNNTTGISLNTGTTSIGNSIRGNSISGNTIGIDLGASGADTNDINDVDMGNNDLQNFPAISSAVINGANLEFDFLVDAATGNSDYDLLVDLYKSDGSRQGQEYLTTITYPAASAQNTFSSTLALGSVVRGDHIVATATDASGNTSEFSEDIFVRQIANFTIDAISNANVNENTTYTSVTPSLSGDTPMGIVTYTLSGTDAADFTINSATGVVSMVARNFENPADDDTDNIYELTITATDSDGNDDSEAWTVTVNDLTESATFTIDAIANTNVNENNAYTSITPNITGTPIGTVTYTLGGTDATDFTINSTTGVVSMVARDFENPVDANTNNVYEVTITATDSDGNDDSEAWTVTVNDLTESATFTIDAIANTNVNENNTYTSVTPNITGTPIGTVSYSLGGTDAADFTINSTTGVVSMVARDFENPVDANTNNVYELTITATDSDGNDDVEAWTVTVNDLTESATFTIDAISNASVDENNTYTSVTPSITGTPIGTVSYSLSGTDATDFTINSTTGVVSMVARDFENPVDANTNNVYEVTITATDSDGNDDSEAWTVTVNDLTESATFTINAIANTNVNENNAYTSVTPSITGAPIGTVTYSIGGTDAADFTINSTTGVVSMVARDFENPVDANTNNVYELTITATDSDGNDDTEAWKVTVNDLTESATFTIDAIANASVDENNAYTSVTPSITGLPIGTVTYTLGGTDAADFTINSATGVVSMVARDFENPADNDTDNVYELTITATDSDGNDDTEAWIVTVNDLTESATFTIDAIANAIVNENNAYTSVTPNITGSPIGTVTYTLGGTDAADFTINSATGVVSMVARDFENPADDDTDNIYELTITATDSDGNDDTEAWMVTVNDLTESATFTIDAIANTNVNENNTYTSVTPSITGTPIGTVTYSLGGTDAADFTINSATGVVSMVAKDFENPVDANTNNVYELTITATDSDGNDDSEAWTVTVNDLTESATFTIDAIANTNVNENNTYTSVTPSITGTPIGTVTYSLGGTDAADFTINSATGVVSMVARDFENPVDANTNNVYEVTITATDSDGNDDSEAWTVTVNDLTESATFTIDPIANTNVNENNTYTSVTPSITGTPIGTVTYSLGGTDAADFTINSTTGVVSMVARDFENPVDANTNNVYEVTITARDADNNTASHNWTVTVNNINDEVFTITGQRNLATNEEVPLNITLADVLVNDPDGLFPLSFTLVVEEGPNYSVLGNTITPDTDFNGQLTVPILVNDRNSEPFNLIVNVNPINDLPIFTSSTPSENYLENNLTPIFNFDANDGDGGGNDDVTYTVLGADANFFTISKTGELSFVQSPDFEAPTDGDLDNVYQIIVSASDGIVSTDLNVVVEVLDVDDDGDIEITKISDDIDNVLITPVNSEVVDVGSTTINIEIETIFEMRNTGDVSIEIYQVTLSDSTNFALLNIPPNIQVDEYAEFTVELLASQTGFFNSTVSMNTSIGVITFEITGEVRDLPKIEVKNVVTPNGDGKHDFLKIKNILLYDNTLVEIFNRNGNKVFSIKDYNNQELVFRGRSNQSSNRDLIQGNYFYIVRSNKKKIGSGFLFLKR
ncbi:cadherin domain-containing protein [Reichenbachiella versicolor]|uniref:cadherin domain-containing protein n=1 Tax=Reichenbachiella versicolor TaxID=1821036 RepID=UPI000D6E6527|nr:cadherin domain-containing protein [Reichenbachiella versicolor]